MASMTSARIYLDFNATAPIDERVRVAMAEVMGELGNPSSIHREGRRARDRVETARRAVAAMVGAQPDEIVFTSGGTEADALGVVGLARHATSTGDAVVVASALEHPAVVGAVRDLESGRLCARPIRCEWAAVDARGHVDLDDLEGRCRGPGVLVMQHCNHELGTLQDVAAAAALARERGMVVHCDAVQSAGKVALDVVALGVDTLAISAHKFGGPKGVGALFVRRGLDLDPLVSGGHQERGRRPGTENVLGIVGMGRAAQLAAERRTRLADTAALATVLEEALLAMPGTRVYGRDGQRIGNTVLVGFDGARGDVVVQALDLAGVSVSTGAACTSGSVEPSEVLLGLGVDRARAAEAVRFSLGPSTRADEIVEVLRRVPGIVARAREFSE